MTAIVALVLALMATGLKPIHEKNAAVYNKRAILSSVNYKLPVEASELSDEEVQEIFNNDITSVALDAEGNVVDQDAIIAAGYTSGNVDAIDPVKEKKKPEDKRLYPLFIYNADDGSKYYITSMAGSGLWDAIWGNVALEDDFTTIAGASFDHAGETPGLGAEIKDNQSWKDQFIGKKIYSADMEYTGVEIMKGPVLHPAYQVDGISGATITSVGVQEMVIRGIQDYEEYFKENGLKVK